MSADLSELNRQLNNIVRIGTIRELDLENARARVSVAGCVTDWLPWGTGRAGNTRTWSPPVIGEQVVLFAPYGDLGQAVIGQSLFQDDNAAPATSADQDTTVYPDGTTVDYNSASHTMDVTMADGGHFNVNIGGGKIEASEGSIKLTVGGVVMNLTSAGLGITGGSVTHNGTNIGSDHTHGGVQSGGSRTAGPG